MRSNSSRRRTRGIFTSPYEHEYAKARLLDIERRDPLYPISYKFSEGRSARRYRNPVAVAAYFEKVKSRIVPLENPPKRPQSQSRPRKGA